MTEITITKTSASKEVSTERREQLPEMISDVPLPRSKQLPSALAWIINAIPKNTEWSREHRTLKKSGKFKSLILSTIYVNSYYVQRKINNIHKLKVLFLQFLARKSSANIFLVIFKLKHCFSFLNQNDLQNKKEIEILQKISSK